MGTVIISGTNCFFYVGETIIGVEDQKGMTEKDEIRRELCRQEEILHLVFSPPNKDTHKTLM